MWLMVIAIYYQMDSNTILYSHFLKALLLCQFISLKFTFSKLDQFIISIFLINSSISINKVRLI